MYRVQAEATSFHYLDAASDPATVAASGLEVSWDPALVVRLQRYADIRVVVFERMLQRKRGDVYYLFWGDGTDLDALDKRILAGTYTDEDFSQSARTVYQVTECSQCRSRWETLVVQPGDPYPGAPGLLQRKISGMRFALCPTCGAVFRQMVAKILGPAKMTAELG